MAECHYVRSHPDEAIAWWRDRQRGDFIAKGRGQRTVRAAFSAGVGRREKIDWSKFQYLARVKSHLGGCHTSQCNSIEIRCTFPPTLTPDTIRFPGAIFFSPATSSDSQLIAFKFQQVVLPGSASYQFLGGCAEGSRTNLVEIASICGHVVAVVAGERLRGRVRAGRGGTRQRLGDRQMRRQ